MSLETINPSNNKILQTENFFTTQELENPQIDIRTENISNINNLLKIANKDDNYIADDATLKLFFDKYIRDPLYKDETKIFLSANCQENLVRSIANEGLEYLIKKQSISVNEYDNLKGIIQEVVRDAIIHAKDHNKAKFFLNININPTKPTNFSFLVINPSNTFSHKFTNSKDKIGNKIKMGLSQEIGGRITHIDYVNNKGNKIYHGFEFIKS